jgi:predicted flavoprotein YhiN
VHEKVADYIERALSRSSEAHGSEAAAGKPDAQRAAVPSEEYARRAAAAVKRFVAPIKGTKGWRDAQITAGGVALSEVHEKYFESKKAPGLFFVGEALDWDGPSGGYNLDHAWDTGTKAGRAAGAYCASYLDT